jgi:serine/threonine-protein kinase
VQSSPNSLPLIDGKYQLVRRLGEGGMGAVFEARHRGTGRRVAVKVIAAASLAKNQEVVARFQREAMASGAIESQYIAQVLDTGIDPPTGSPYTVMELLTGEDLQQAMQRMGALTPDAALRVAAQACLGLRKAHESQVVHRDIKPANLYLAKREDDIVVKLLDFGIAKVKADQLAAASEKASLTATGAMIGSPLYMSPEQARGKKDIDHRTDIWSLGVVLYEALSGVTPYGHVDTVGELILQICSTPPRHIQDLAPWVPAEAAAVVHRALAMNPAHRFDSAAQMFDALRVLVPQGYSLSESTLVGMPQAARANVAPRLEISSGLRAPPPSSDVISQPIAVASSGAGVGGGTMNGLENADTVLASRRSRMVVLVPLALGMAALGAFLVSRIVAPHHDGAAPAAASAPAIAAVPSAVESAALVPLPAAPAERTVRVVVLPAEALAKVDGVDAPVQAGLLAITGSVGSVHHVHLSAGRREASFDVAIAEEGPVPPKVELEMPAARPAGGAPAPPTPRAAAPPPAPTGGMHMEMK